MPAEVSKAWRELLGAVHPRIGRARVMVAMLMTVDPTTVYRWTVGESAPHPLVQEKLNALCASKKLAPVYERTVEDGTT